MVLIRGNFISPYTIKSEGLLIYAERQKYTL